MFYISPNRVRITQRRLRRCGACERLRSEQRLERLYLLTRPERIALFRFLLEGYDGLVVLSTLDAATGLVRLLFPASRQGELLELLAALEQELDLEPADIDQKNEV